MIKFVDLERQAQQLGKDIELAISRILKSYYFLRSPEVTAFEKSFAELLGAAHCISTANGTDSLYICMKALGVRPGDEVIVPAITWISTAEAVSLCGAIPVFADIHPNTYCIDPRSVSEKLSSKTKAICAVHLYGHMADMNALKNICTEHSLALIEDCAQAHLSYLGNSPAGTFADMSAFSFYPTKNLGAYGDAGCIITNSSELAETARRLSNHGALEKNDHKIEGITSRMDAIQAAILSTKLPHLKSWTEKRRKNAERYETNLKSLEAVRTPSTSPGHQHSFHIYAIQAEHRDELRSYLFSKGIQTEVHYPCALPFVEAYKRFNLKVSEFPVGANFQNRTLSLPIYPELGVDEIDYICDSIRNFYKS